MLGLFNRINLIRKSCRYGKNLKIAGRMYIHGAKNGVHIGNDCVIQSNSNVNPTSGFNNTHLCVGSKGSIFIGDNVGISHANITSFDKVTIENHVLIGSGVMICDSDFHSIDYTYRMEKPDTHVKTSPVVIKEGAFIGARSIILKGVTVGRHSVVGAGSVVTKNIPDNEIWAGNPAVFIKQIGGGGTGN